MNKISKQNKDQIATQIWRSLQIPSTHLTMTKRKDLKMGSSEAQGDPFGLGSSSSNHELSCGYTGAQLQMIRTHFREEPCWSEWCGEWC
jgi:hypothetical protein